MKNQIETMIKDNLTGEDQQVALRFAAYLRQNQFDLIRDEGACWKDKIYFWIEYKKECVAFLAIRDPEEPENRWTVWSDDIPSEYLQEDIAETSLQQAAWNYVDECGHCGSCGGGSQKVIFGKTFAAVCGCTFRIDNPKSTDLPFLEYMIETKVKQIDAVL